MDLNTVFTKTAKASRTSMLWGGGLSSEFKRVLSQIDGVQSVDDILRQSEKMTKNELQKILLELEKDGYIHRLSHREAEPEWLKNINSYPISADNNYSIAVEEINADEFNFGDTAFSPQTTARIKETAEQKVHPEAEAIGKSADEIKSSEELAVKAKREAERKAQAEAAEKVRREAAEQAKRIAEVEAKARQEIERIEREKAEVAAKAQAEERKAKAEAEKQAQVQAELKAQINAAEQARLQAERIAREQAEALARIEAERKAQEAHAARARQQAEENARLEAERIEREKAEAVAKAEEQARLKAEHEAKTEAKEKARVEAELKARIEAAEQARLEAERIAREQAEALAKVEAERKLQEEQVAKARQEAEENARLEAERMEREKAEAIAKAKLEAEEQARIDAERKAEVEALAKAEAERKLQEEQAAKARQEAEENARLEAERMKREKAEAVDKAKAEEQARLKAERAAKAEAKEKSRVEAELKARIEAAEQARLQAEQIAREQAEALAKVEAERKLQEEQVAKARQEAEENARLEAERMEREKAEAVAKAKSEAEEQVRIDAERKAEVEAEENAKLEAERIAREQDEEKAWLEAERIEREKAEAALKIAGEIAEDTRFMDTTDQMAKADDEEQLRVQAERKALAEAAEQAMHKVESLTREDVEALVQDEVKQRAEQDKEAKAKLKAEEKARKKRTRGQFMANKWVAKSIKALPIIAPLAVLLIVGLIHVVNLSMLIKPIEKLASASVGEAVTVGEVHATLFPELQLKLADVAVGSAADVKIASVNIQADISMLFKEEKVLKSLEISTFTLTPAGLGRQVQWVKSAAKADKLKIEKITLKQISFRIPGLELEPFDGKLALTASGELSSVELVNAGRNLTLLLTPQHGSCAVTLTASAWQPSLLKQLELDEVTATGVISQNQASFSQIEAKAFGGTIKAQGMVDWTGRLSASGNFELIKITLPRLLSAFGSGASMDGTLNANAAFASGADQASGLVQGAEVNARFEVLNGKINGIALSHALMSGPASKPLPDADFTRFDTLAGNLQFKSGQYNYKQLELKTEQFRAHGNLDIESDKMVSGKISAELASKTMRRQASFNVSGTSADIRLQ